MYWCFEINPINTYVLDASEEERVESMLESIHNEFEDEEYQYGVKNCSSVLFIENQMNNKI